MDELTFRAIFVAFGVVLVGVLFFIFSRKSDRKTYIVPVIVGFLFGSLTDLAFGTGVYSFALGGILTGYILKDVSGWSQRIRAGGLNATLIVITIFIPSSIFILSNSLSGILAEIAATGVIATTEQVLYTFIIYFLLNSFLVIAIVVLGAILGSYLRRVLKPSERKVEEPKKQAE